VIEWHQISDKSQRMGKRALVGPGKSMAPGSIRSSSYNNTEKIGDVAGSTNSGKIDFTSNARKEGAHWSIIQD
jgi:hypothetical protein